MEMFEEYYAQHSHVDSRGLEGMEIASFWHFISLTFYSSHSCHLRTYSPHSSRHIIHLPILLFPHNFIMASIASAGPPDLEASENGNLSNLRKNELAKRLQNAGIKYSTDALKSELQALCALSQQGVLRRGAIPDAVLVAKVVGWINLPVKDQVKLLKEKKLDTSGHRWDHIEVLITAESVVLFPRCLGAYTHLV